MKVIMIKQQLLADIKRLLREPILAIIFFVPLLALTAIKLMLLFGMPILYRETGFDLTPYYGYILSIVLFISPMMLGAVTGFIMIDDRDERITDLISITPLGYWGYLGNRLLLPFLSSILYTLLGYSILDINELDGLRLSLLSLMMGIESIIVGLILFLISDNKVKGLTYAKGLSGLMVTALADLAHIPWLSVLCGFLPFYWVCRLIVQPLSIFTIIMLLLVHGFWLGAALFKAHKS